MSHQREKTPFSDNPFFLVIGYWTLAADKFEQLIEKPWMAPVKAGYQALERKDDVKRAQWQADRAWALGGGVYRYSYNPSSNFDIWILLPLLRQKKTCCFTL
jgi:hypothetical protein